jgi:hypothetical protein
VQEGQAGPVELFCSLAIQDRGALRDSRRLEGDSDFESDAAGRKWIEKNGVKVAPLIQALMLNIKLSDDLIEALRSFFDGIGLVGEVLDRLNLGGETESGESDQDS